MNIFSNIFRRDKNQAKAPQSNIGLYSRQQKNQITSPNKSVAPKLATASNQQRATTYRLPQTNASSNPMAGLQRVQQQARQTATRPPTQPRSNFGISPAVQKITQRPRVSSNPMAGLERIQQIARGGVNASRIPNASYETGRTTAPVPEQPEAQPYDPYSKLRSFYDSSQQNRLQGIDEQAQLDQDTIRQTFDAQNQALGAQIPGITEGYEQFKADVLAGMADEEAQTGRDVERTEEQAGGAQRQIAQDARQLRGLRERQYGALGTVDSYGTGSFTQANANDDADVLRMTNENTQRKLDRINQLETGLRQFKRQAQAIINSENAKARQIIQQINADMTMNSIQKQSAIAQVVLDARNNKNAVREELEGYRLQLEQERNAVDDSGPSQQFLATGRPQTPSDIEFLQKNPDAMNTYLEGIGQGGGNEDAKQASSTINELLSRNLGGVSGLTANAPWNTYGGSESNYTRAQLQKLTGLLSLEARQKLKGQGTITDNEMKILERSIGALGLADNGTSNLSEADLRRELGNIQVILNKAGGGQQQAGMQNDPLGLGF